MKLTQKELEAAQSVVYTHMQPTPSYLWPQLAAELGVELWLKHENHTPIGAFKVRGGLVYADYLQSEGLSGPLVTATRGNHGQSIPFAASKVGLPVTVVVPKGNSKEKNAAMRHWGAQLVEFGEDFDAARGEAQRIAESTNGHMVPSFHKALVQGVATYGAELFAAVANLDVVYVPIGMGSGVCSMILVRDLLGLPTKIVGVVSEHANAIAQSIAAGQIVTTPTAHTFADGMATRMPDANAFAIMQQGLERVVSVSDTEVADAIRLIYSTTHNVAEGAGAAATAAVAQERELMQGQRVAAILSGGNIDSDWFAQILRGQTPVINS